VTKNRIVLPDDEITPEALFNSRREFLQMAAVAGVAAALPQSLLAAGTPAFPRYRANKALSTTELKTSYTNATHYNNYYEFDTSKFTPATLASHFNTRPWTITIDGEVKKPKVIDLDHILKLAPLEERVYRFRCVEGWSMVLPWLGYPLSKLLAQIQPTSRAKYVEFTSLYDPVQMPNQLKNDLVWPYKEGLRMDEAMNPLTLLTVGLYGGALPNQCGAPVRIVVPWKYGFKSPKAIVHIRLLSQLPITSWMQASPTEYGFYSNVNHPRWSQATEQRVGERGRRLTELYNGYGSYVAKLYKKMDLVANF